jgi:AcrR family transcriptional regulator
MAAISVYATDMERTLPTARGVAPRTHQERREQARERILWAAMTIVARKGLDALTLARAGEEAGYSRALPGHYFGSKDELVAALSAAVMEEHAARLARLAAAPPGLDGFLAGLRAHIVENAADDETIRAFFAFLGAALERPVLAEAARKLTAEGVARLAARIEADIALGGMAEGLDPAIEARLITASVRGLLTQWLADPEAFPLEAATDRLLALLRTGLAAPSAAA